MSCTQRKDKRMTAIDLPPRHALARAVLLGLGMALASLPATAQTPTSAGQQLATEYCARCHIVAPNGSGGWTNAPAFQTIADNRQSTAAGLSTFIQTEHEKMLNTGRPRNEADEIAAYIISLRRQ
jgi:mono/diheme cytochrome c family protein